MKKALIAYLSKSGTTKYFAHNIGEHLKANNIETTVSSIYDISPESVAEYDIVLLGCWTHGIFIAFQHPTKEWVNWSKQLPDLNNKKVGLFTTYKLATGSMFKKMQKSLIQTTNKPLFNLKSKGEDLLQIHKSVIDEFIE